MQPHRALCRRGRVARGRPTAVAMLAHRSGSTSACLARCSTGSRTKRRRSISSVSRRGSTRWCRARARSSARCARRLRGGHARAAARPALPAGDPRGKKVRTETAIGESPASVSSAAAALAEQVFGDLQGCSVAARRRREDRRAGCAQPRVAWRRDRVRREPFARARRGADGAVRRRAVTLDGLAGGARRASTSSSPRRARRAKCCRRRTSRRGSPSGKGGRCS